MFTRILEIGTGNGDLTLALADLLAPDGMLITMEADAARAAAARRRFTTAGHAQRISVIAGEPARFLHKIRGPFDVIVQRVAAPSERIAVLLKSGGVLIGADPKYSEKDMTIAEWLAHTKADAEKRGLPELIPMLDGLAQATERLRQADWNDHPDTETPFDLAQGRPADDDNQ